MDVMPANDASTAGGAQVGTWWKNKGPLFYTYTYEDIANSQLTIYMRANLFVPWTSYRIARCDGKGPIITFSESGNWVTNHIRSLFRVNQAQTYGIWFDSEKVADVQEVSSGYPSLTTTNFTTGEEVASALLKDRNFHGNYDQWYVSNDEKNSMPFWVLSAITVPFAYDEADEKAKAGAADAANQAPATPGPSFLAAESQGSLHRPNDKQEAPVAVADLPPCLIPESELSSRCSADDLKATASADAPSCACGHLFAARMRELEKRHTCSGWGPKGAYSFAEATGIALSKCTRRLAETSRADEEGSTDEIQRTARLV